jgi:hypothetical protein
MVSLSGRYQCNRETYLRRLPNPTQPMPTCEGVQPMKLTRRGRLLRSVLILTIVTSGVWFYTTHHKVYGNCHITVDGRVCDLIRWESNK